MRLIINKLKKNIKEKDNFKPCKIKDSKFFKKCKIGGGNDPNINEDKLNDLLIEALKDINNYDDNLPNLEDEQEEEQGENIEEYYEKGNNILKWNEKYKMKKYFESDYKILPDSCVIYYPNYLNVKSKFLIKRPSLTSLF